ncbi:site-specific DNA-methyltransferase [Aphanizomenon flos-aquae NRERC-008]|uniref:Methyltransferase n=1 Tax=Aphanizomenon flos-aquae FACHB-1249 TaxID=2692889 RepID=A0ABR8ISL0_APHFL|nr:MULTISPECIES: site-specific DNA-methyltransferase [Aphanizomenon]MBD2390338.1 site-specific DNA-methyltransferase [Aphanizomenon flos-aquae FACHB-1171]MBD2555621.1 site-specific DNA-methyltransferase [Aphanizomenon flos-aquae FACHB-1290]MBD2631381.1 site-specific DNA-methyltransferase [Aphanizomenon sp. FACHB-1399]MBD2655693.1 site-specific DNA-methyltransferase [Aphanizomenon flos-aquae FACHB-1265]MBD2685481.1 site-specific DNA-methyltransferase [Aphanizomenon flos-aquae FACHB-1249]MCE290
MINYITANLPLFTNPDRKLIIKLEEINTLDFEQSNFIINAEVSEALKKLPDNIVQTIITSPPYYDQRDYHTDEQIGNEESPEQYINRLIEVFDQAKRVLKEDGTLWLNLGDKYIDGNLAGLPWKLALSLKERGWILRSDIIWYKPNAMPSSVKNRPTTDHEYIFLFAKSSKYYYDADSIREPHVTFSEKSKMKGGRNHLGKAGGTPELGKNGGNSNLHKGRWDQAFHPKGRNKRTVWEVPLSKFRDAHFAVFPEQLIEPCILAGSPEGGIILDPFFGAGTVGLVSINKGRKFIGIDINHQYCEIAAKRIFH